MTSAAQPGATVAERHGALLAQELGCGNCHTHLGENNRLRSQIPDLRHAGLRYNPAWLFEFLQSPTRVRRHIGAARMPDFHLSAPEAVALVAYLETQRATPTNWPAMPAAVQERIGQAPQSVTSEQFHAVLAGGVMCMSCHTLEGKGGNKAVDLTTAGYRLQFDWLKQYLVSPAMFGVDPTNMPAQFYGVGQRRDHFEELTPGAANKLHQVADYVFGLAAARRRTLETNLATNRARYPAATAAAGERIFHAQNCRACHDQTASARIANAAPDISQEGRRVQAKWLANFLAEPAAVRPFGFQPGTGSRMPNFHLAPSEVLALTRFLMNLGASVQEEGFRPATLTLFAHEKARLLMSEKLSCLGCHRLGDVGGRIGPDLTAAKVRLQPGYLHEVIRNPRGVNPHTIMPQVPLSRATVDLLANYLTQHEMPPARRDYLPLLETPLLRLEDVMVDAQSATGRYGRHCAACHGAQGHGDGYNAIFLTRKPTVHADSVYMSSRPDDTLYDGIHSGGYILNKSPGMPPWGRTFEAAEIRELVRHMRALCNCEGPDWSRLRGR